MNSLFSHPAFYAILMVSAGFGIPMMATLNAGVGVKFSSPLFATIILIIVALVTATAVMITSGTVPNKVFDSSIPFHYYFAGCLFVFYIATISWVAPKFGVGNSIAFVLLGQLISISIIDHFSLFNAIHTPITWRRVSGLLLMMAGIYLVVKKN